MINSSYDSDVCSCGGHLNAFETCISSYPCLQIQASYLRTIPPVPSSYQSSYLNMLSAAASFQGQELHNESSNQRNFKTSQSRLNDMDDRNSTFYQQVDKQPEVYFPALTLSNLSLNLLNFSSPGIIANKSIKPSLIDGSVGQLKGISSTAVSFNKQDNDAAGSKVQLARLYRSWDYSIKVEVSDNLLDGIQCLPLISIKPDCLLGCLD